MSTSSDPNSLDSLAQQLGIDIHHTQESASSVNDGTYLALADLGTNHTDPNHPLAGTGQDYHKLENSNPFNQQSNWLHKPDQLFTDTNQHLQQELGNSGFSHLNALNQHSRWLESEPQTVSDHTYSLPDLNSYSTTNINDPYMSGQQYNYNLSSQPSILPSNAASEFHSDPVVCNSHSDDSYVYFSDVDNVWRHNRDGSETLVGHVKNQHFYRGSDDIGKLGTDWKIYDSHGECVGYVDSNCDVHRPDGTIVHHSNTALGGAAWMLYIGMGGRP